jgi:hypothetical protein
LASTLALLVAMAGAVWAEDEGPTVELSVPYYTKYMSRGFLTVNDPVLQPGATVGYKGFCVNVWGNYNLTDKIGKKDKFSEVDLTAQYTFELGDFSLPVGVIHYLYPNMAQPSTTEVFAAASYKWIVTPTFTVYQDVGDQHGTYATLALGYELELPAPMADVAWGLAFQLQGGWGSADYCKYGYNWGVDSAHFTDILFSVGLPIKIKEFLTVKPGFYQVWLVDSEIRDAAGWDSKNYFGLTLTFAF